MKPCETRSGDSAGNAERAHGGLADPPASECVSEGLDMSIDIMEAEARAVSTGEPDPWLARRLLTIGASEVPALYLALGMVVAEEKPPRYLRDLAKSLVQIKAGLRRGSKGGLAAARGNDVEGDIIEAFNADRGPWPRVTWARWAAPVEWMPLVDRHCPRLSATPDAWARMGGELVNVQVKSTVRPDAHLGPWWHRLQVQAEMAVTGAGASILLYGRGWAGWTENMRRAPEPVVVERDDEEIERIREAARRGWRLVEEMATARGR